MNLRPSGYEPDELPTAPPGLGRTVPVHLHGKVTEVGQLELACISHDGKHKWKLQFNVREQ